MTMRPPKNPTADRVRPLTRLVAVAVVPFLLAAFFILYFDNALTGERFAWSIASPLTAAIMGAGYLGGAFFFIRTALESRWHRVAAGFPPVAAFTAVMLLTTLLHWDTFDPGHWPFQIWLALYAATPFLVTLVWWRNRPEDDGSVETYDLPVSRGVRLGMGFAGLVATALAIGFLAAPALAVRVWPWPLTPLTARVVAGWMTLLGVGALVLSREPRWSGWRLPLQSIILWQLFTLQACVAHAEDFHSKTWLNGFTFLTALAVLALIVLSGLNEGVVRDRAHRGLRDPGGR